MSLVGTVTLESCLVSASRPRAKLIPADTSFTFITDVRDDKVLSNS